MRLTHLDAAESAFFERQLEHVKAQTYDIKYPRLRAREFVPVTNEAGAGALTVTYRQYDKVGRAKIAAPGAVDAPRVDVFGNEFPRPVRLVTDSFGYHLLEIRSAARAGLPLEQRRANAARVAIEEILDEVACFGSPEDGITDGFLNNANVELMSSTGLWTVLTPDEVIADVARMFAEVDTDTNSVETPNTLLLAPAEYTHIATTPRADNSDTTILQFLLNSFPDLQAIEKWYRLTGAGTSSVNLAVLYDRSPMALQQDIPSEFEQLPVFQKGQNFEIECMATTAGTSIYYPGSMKYMDIAAP